MASATRDVMRMIARDLELVGVHVKDPTDLVQTDEPYPAAVPVLMRWIDQLRTIELSDADRSYLWETLARALTVREARHVAGHALVRPFMKSNFRR